MNLQKHLRKVPYDTFSTKLSILELELYGSIAEILEDGTCCTPLETTVTNLQVAQQNVLDDMLFENKDSGVLFFRGTKRITFESDPSECVRLYAMQMTVNQEHWVAEMCHAKEIMRLWCSFATK